MTGRRHRFPVLRDGPSAGLRLRAGRAARRAVFLPAIVALASLGLAACSGSTPAPETSLSPRVVSKGQPVPRGGGVYKVGKPYRIAGRWYYPKHDPSYDRVGIASWYGAMFHGRRTANGEVYDMNALTAAHPTMPLPSYAKVTNLANGRTLIVRVNDRGPYKPGRVIDLSRKAARLLGFERRGTARVRVRYVGRAPMNGDDSYERLFAASQPWYRRRIAAGELKAPAPARRTRTAALRPRAAPAPHHAAHAYRRWALGRGTGGIFVQAGAFRNPGNAHRVRERLASLGPVNVEALDGRAGALYRVRVGPFADADAARSTLERVRDAGLADARLVAR